MKKTIISLLLMAAPVAIFAQLTVFSTGSNNVSIKTTAENPYAYLMVSPSTYTSGYSSYSIGTLSSTYLTNYYNVGVFGTAFSESSVSSKLSFGVIGKAGNGTYGNYGVYGMLSGTQNGGAVVGAISNSMGVTITGQYAGYFNGTTKVNGTLYANSIVNSSDIRLKDNIVDFKDMEEGHTTLDNIEKMNVIAYNYRPYANIPDAVRDTMKAEDLKTYEEIARVRHYGLLAQELQEIYPDLVYEGQDGYLGINYVELVPVLIRSIQELKKEVEELKAQEYQTRGVGLGSETSSVNPAIFSGEEDHKTYSMQGRLANNPSKGVYIKNGRKQIVK